MSEREKVVVPPLDGRTEREGEAPSLSSAPVPEADDLLADAAEFSDLLRDIAALKDADTIVEHMAASTYEKGGSSE